MGGCDVGSGGVDSVVGGCDVGFGGAGFSSVREGCDVDSGRVGSIVGALGAGDLGVGSGLETERGGGVGVLSRGVGSG